MKWTFKKYLLRAFITFLALFIALNTYKAVMKPIEPIRIIQQHEQIADSEYIISEEMVLSKLKVKSQIVSLEQELHKTDTYIDDGLLGERNTELTVNGVYKLGLETKDIKVNHIDNENGIVYIELPKPTLISLDIPYNDIEFDKTKGWLRLSMSEEEQKNFYSATKKNIEHELMKDKEIMKTADLYNRDVVESILNLIPEVKSVVFN